MADNLVADPGVGGATFATDDIAGVHYPRSKIVWGADGTATDTAAGAAAIPIQDGGNTITVDGTVELGATALAALETITVASVTAPLAAGTNNIGDVDVLTLPALVAGTANIGDVDVLTVPAPLSTTGGGTEAAALRVTLATDSTGVVSVDDNGASLTVDGTVTANLAAGTNNIGDVDVLTLPALPAGTNNIGDVDVLTIAAGDNNIGNVDVVSLPALVAGTANIGDVDIASIAAGDNNIGNVDVVTLPALVAGTANIGDVDVLTLPAIPTGTNSIGRVNPEPQTANGLSVSRLISAATTNETEAKATAGQLYGVTAHNINAAVRYLKIYDNTAAGTVIGTTTPKMTLPIPGNAAGAGFMLDTGGMGIAFGTGITYGLTTGVADSDTAAVAANEIVIHLLFK